MNPMKKRGEPGKGILPHLPDEIMRVDRMRIKTDGVAEAWKYSFQRSQTTADFRNGLPIGNGDFGCTVRGYPDCMTFQLAKNDLWWDNFESAVPCYYEGGIEDIRQRVKAGDASIKMDIYEASNHRRNCQSQTTAAKLTLHLTEGAIPCHFSERIDPATGFAVTEYSCGDVNGRIHGRNFQILSSISRANEVMEIACNASPDCGEMGHFRFELTRTPMEVTSQYHLSKTEIAAMEKEIEDHYSPVCFIDGACAGFHMRLRAGQSPDTSPDVHYTVLLTVQGAEVNYYTAGHMLYAEGVGGRSVKIYLTMVSTYDAEDTMAEAKRRLDKTLACGLCGELAYEDNTRFWKRSWVRLPKPEYGRLWYWGVYEANAARRPGKFAPGYIAPWFSSCYGNWGFHILTYEQTKSNLGLLASNHAELLEPWFRLCRDAQDKVKKFTKNFYGMNGVCFPHAISGTGEVVASAIYLNGTQMNIHTTGETVKYAWDYYDFTGDEDFLREIGYPLLKEAAIFYSEYLQTDENGMKYIFPSRSQEFVNHPAALNEFMTNSIIDLAYFKYILRRAAQAARILGIDDAYIQRWEDDVLHLRDDYETFPDGSWKPAEDWDAFTMDYGVPSVTDLTPIVLTDEVDAWRGDEELLRAAQITVNKCVPADKMPWDLSFGILAKLRMGDKNYAKLALELLPKCREGGNLNRADACDYDQNNEMKPDGQHDFFVDKGTACFADVVNEMLLQSQGGIIRLFPAYPEDIGDAAFYSLRARGAFLVSGEFRDGVVAYGIIRSLKGNRCTVAAPFGADTIVRNLDTGETVAYEMDGDTIVFDTIAEYEYVVEHKDHVLESFSLK